jgi:hypothetical protein
MSFSGHDHHYERTEVIYNRQTQHSGTDVPSDIQGTTYVVTGGAGAPLYSAGSDWWTDISTSRNHYCVLTAYSDRIEMVVKNSNGSVIESFIRRKYNYNSDDSDGDGSDDGSVTEENVVLSANGGVLESFTSEYGQGWNAEDLTNGITSEDGWASALNPQNQEFVYSFKNGQNATLQEAIIYSGTAEGTYFSRNVEVWTSTNGNNYTKVAGDSLANRENSITLNLRDTVAKRVKLVIKSGYLSDFWELGEFVVNGVLGE